MMTCAHVLDLKENNFGRTVCPLSFVVIALIFSELRELVKTILHARDPLFGGQGKEETMGLSSWVGGYMREHGSLKLGGGIYERTWVSQAGWGDI